MTVYYKANAITIYFIKTSKYDNLTSFYLYIII